MLSPPVFGRLFYIARGMMMKFLTKSMGTLLAMAVLSACQSSTVTSGQNTPTFANVAYTQTNLSAQKLDLYLPKNVTGKTPLMIYVHGGGWAVGDKSDASVSKIDAHQFVNALLKQGYAVASVNYRLVGEAKFPAQLDDMNAIFAFLKANADKYAFDMDKVATIGESAGGHLAQLLAVKQGVPNIKAVVSFYGESDMVNIQKDRLNIAECAKPTEEMMAFFGGIPEANLLNQQEGSLAYQQKAKEASPLYNINKNTPAMLLLHGTADCTVPAVQSVRLHKALKNQGVDSELMLIDGYPHNDNRFFNDKMLTNKILAFLNRQFQNK